MSLQKSLNVETRTAHGTGPNRRLRASGLVPGVYYDGKGENVAVQVPALPLSKAYEALGTTQVFDLVIKGGDAPMTKPAIIWKLQHHPFKRQIVHVDFYGVDLTKELHVSVPVQITGECRAVKDEGGMLSVFREHLDVVCLPLAIPEHIVIDVSELKLGTNITIEDLTFPEGVRPVYDEAFAVVGVSIPASAEEIEAAEAAEAAEAEEAAEEAGDEA